MTKRDSERTGDNRNGHVVVVEFDVTPAHIDAFVTMVRENARLSVEREAGCRRFDVLLPAGVGGVGRVLLYEIYDDRGAFDAHLQTDHFLDFDSASRPLVAAKRVAEYALFEAVK